MEKQIKRQVNKHEPNKNANNQQNKKIATQFFKTIKNKRTIGK